MVRNNKNCSQNVDIDDSEGSLSRSIASSDGEGGIEDEERLG